MFFQFSGKVALVTGGSSGMGRATAIAYAKEGIKVVVADRNVQGGEETVSLIKANGGEAIFIQCDVSKEDQVENLVKKTIEAYGRLDYAFNNAGIPAPQIEFVDFDAETYDKISDVDLKGYWLCMKYEISQMLKFPHSYRCALYQSRTALRLSSLTRSPLWSIISSISSSSGVRSSFSARPLSAVLTMISIMGR